MSRNENGDAGERKRVADEIRDFVGRPSSERMGVDLGPLDLRAVAERLGRDPGRFATTLELRQIVADEAGVKSPRPEDGFSLDEKEAILDALVG